MALQLSEIERHLAGNYCIRYLPETTSTNDLALALARGGEPGGALICADYQAAGRGRHGAVWVAPPGTCVLFSLLLRPPRALPPALLAVLTGVGAAEGLRRLGVPAEIKWPNDIILAEHKVGGILVETTGDAVVTGVGINCRVPAEAFPARSTVPAGSLHHLLGREISREMVLLRVVQGLSAAFDMAQQNPAALADAWNRLNWLAGRRVRLVTPDGVVEGDGLAVNLADGVLETRYGARTVAVPLVSTVEAG